METNYFELFGVPTPEPAAEDGADKKLCSPEGEASDAKPE